MGTDAAVGGDGAVTDGGVSTDGGVVTDGGCGCRTVRSEAPSALWLLGLGLLFLRRRRRQAALRFELADPSSFARGPSAGPDD